MKSINHNALCPGPLSEGEMKNISEATQRVETFSELMADLNTALETPTPSAEQILEFE